MSKLKEFLNSWQFRRRRIFDLLANATEEDLSFSPGGGMGTLAKQFRHLSNVQHVYLEAIKDGKINFSKKIYDKSFDEKEKLIEILKAEDKYMVELLAGLSDQDWEKEIDWGGTHNPKVEEHLDWLIGHETLHQGQLIIYWKLLGRSFPESWKSWNL